MERLNLRMRKDCWLSAIVLRTSLELAATFTVWKLARCSGDWVLRSWVGFLLWWELRAASVDSFDWRGLDLECENWLDLRTPFTWGFAA